MASVNGVFTCHRAVQLGAGGPVGLHVGLPLGGAGLAIQQYPVL